MRGSVWQGEARALRGWVGLGMAKRGEAMSCLVWSGKALHGNAGRRAVRSRSVWLGDARPGVVWLGAARQSAVRWG
jgi:hypothetical protein